MLQSRIESAYTQREARIGAYVALTLWLLTATGIAGLAIWSLGMPSSI